DGIGFVSGFTKYLSAGGDREGRSIGIYAKMERLTKTLESRIGSCVGADGALFAVRKRLYPPLQEADINDLVIPLIIIKQGYRGKFEEKAFCVERTAGSGKGEFHRQVRITNRTIRAIFNHAELMNPFRHGLFAFQLLSHKMSKFLTPFFMALLLLTNVLLVMEGALYPLLFAGQLLFYFLAAPKAPKLPSRFAEGFISIAGAFVTVNLAILWGWAQYFRGKTYTTWAPIRR
ncbi:MAG TPA: hypothetical protein VIK48_02875, partial [Candidatus Manganitrophaceae bacterium]